MNFHLISGLIFFLISGIAELKSRSREPWHTVLPTIVLCCLRLVPFSLAVLNSTGIEYLILECVMYTQCFLFCH